MDKTKKLRDLITNRYGSIREFAKVVEIPSTTLTSALDKGIGGMAIDRVIKICEFLNIDVKTFEPLKESAMNDNLSDNEEVLLKNFNKLNDLGKKEANKRVSELTEISKYIDENTITTFAAHDDGLDPDKAKERIEKAKEIFKQMDEEK